MNQKRHGRQGYIYGNVVTKPKQNLVLIKNKKKQENKAKSILKRTLIFLELALVLAISVSIAIDFLSIKAKNTQAREEIIKLESQLNALKEENNDSLTKIKSSINLEEIKQRALELGMYYPDESQVIFYKDIDDDYVRQINPIP